MKKDKLLGQLINAYKRLQKALEIPLSEPLTLDGTIQRFEFTFELAWKTIKVFLEDQGIICHSPKACLKEAFKIGWIDNEENWIIILKARNMTSHVYNEEMAMEIYEAIRSNHHLIKELIAILKEY